MKERIIHTPDDLAAAARNLHGLRDHLPIKVAVEKYSPRRSLDQNDKLHAVCRDVSRHCEWAGRKLEAEDWKRLFVDAWSREAGHSGSVVPSLDGKGIVSLGLQTRRMSKAQLSELIEWIHAWGSNQGVEWSDSL